MWDHLSHAIYIYIYIYICIRKRKSGGRLTLRDLYIVTKKWLEGAYREGHIQTRKRKVGIHPTSNTNKKKTVGGRL